MIKNINVKSEDALQELTQFKDKQFVRCDVRFQNVHLTNVDKLIGSNLFIKNDLFVNSQTLWSLMQEKGRDTSHNHHGLTPVDILDALSNIQNPYCVFITKYERISVIVSCLSHYGEPLMAIIEIGSSLIDDMNANVNKLVTMHPKDNVDKIVNKLSQDKLLYVNRLAFPK